MVKNRTPTINGLRNDDSRANLFAESVKKTCTPNSGKKNAVFKENFTNHLLTMSADS